MWMGRAPFARTPRVIGSRGEPEGRGGVRGSSVMFVVLVLVPFLTAATRDAPRGEVLDELFPSRAVAPGVTHREFSTTAPAGKVRGDVVEVDLGAPGVRTDLLTAGAVADRSSVKSMADGAGAAAKINGDIFDIGRSGAAVGPEVQGGRPRKAAVPPGRRYGPAVPGAQPDHVFAVGTDGVGRVDRLALDARVRGPGGDLPAVALNQHAVPVGGIGIVTADWGAADRWRMLCGSSDVDPPAPCAADRLEVRVREGVVTAVGAPAAGTLVPGEIALEGREQGAAACGRSRWVRASRSTTRFDRRAGSRRRSRSAAAPSCGATPPSPGWTRGSGPRAAPSPWRRAGGGCSW